MADRWGAAEILKRALEYPYAAPERSYLYLDGVAAELPGPGYHLSGRSPLLAYGANASPDALARKLATLPGVEMPVLRADLEDFDVVYSAHVSPYGAIPATLRRSPGTVAPVFVAYPNEAQRRLLPVTEPNYELRRLERIRCRVVDVGTLSEVEAFLSRHGCLRLDGAEVALAALASAGRTLREMDEREVLERARDLLEPGMALEEFVAGVLDPGVAATRTATLRATANRSVFDRGTAE